MCRDIPEPRTDKHQCGIAVGKRTYDICTASDLLHDPLHGIVGPDASPVLSRIRHVGQRFAASGSFMARSFAATSFDFSTAASRSSCACTAFNIATTSFIFVYGTFAHTLR